MTTIILSDGVDTVSLPGDLIWQEHFGWSSVVQQTAYTLTGALVVETATKQAGRPITLTSGDNFGIIKKQQADQLLVWAGIAGKALVLSAHGNNYNVMMRHEDAPAVQAVALASGKNPLASDDWMQITIKLMEI